MKLQRLVAGLAVVAFCCLVLVAVQPLAGQGDKGEQGPTSKAKIYVYPKKVTAKDKLSFGPGKDGKEIPIKGESTLIYVDLAPDARFAHGTQCILISTEGAQVTKGNWWLMLNGEPLFRGEEKDYKVDFPITVLGN
jgi:hypothetical protein